ncbi:MAG TPA: hypothetical protein VFZ53_01245 [Polyangiaceae bacterium]
MPKSKNSEKTGSRGSVEGEGSYTATRAYNKHLASALSDKKSIERGAERARKAVDGPEGASLREAEKRGKSGPRGAKAARAR